MAQTESTSQHDLASAARRVLDAWLRLVTPARTPRRAGMLRQARLLSAILVMVAGLGAVFEALTVWMFASQGYRTHPIVIAMYVLLAIAYLLNHRGRMEIAAWIAVFGVSWVVFVITFDTHGAPIDTDFLYYLVLPLVAAGIFLPAYALPLLAAGYLAVMGAAALLIKGLLFELLLIGPGFYVLAVTGVISLYNRHRAMLEEDRHRDLEHSEQRYRTLFEGANDAIFLADPSYRFIDANRKAADLLGYSQDELRSMNVLDVFAGAERPQALEIQQALWAGKALPIFEFSMVRRYGSTFPAEINATLVHDPEGRPAFIQSVVRDISDRKAAEAQIHRQVAHLGALRQIDLMITSGHSLPEMMDTLLEQTCVQLEADAVGMLLVDPSGAELKLAGARGISEGVLSNSFAELKRLLQSWQAGETQAVRLPKSKTGTVFVQFAECFAAPLCVKGQVKGGLLVFLDRPFAPPAEWLGFLEMLAGQAAIAVDSAEMYDGLQRSHVELLASYDATLEGWARALELRDNETQGHSRRVTMLAVELAGRLGMSEADLVHFRRGALLHDIGKMGVPDAILFKPGPLSHEEWDLMHMHPIYAREMLAQIPFLAPALDIPYGHHERWDGSGYPQGLRGEAIPWGARIFAVADVWDALTSDRPYRPAWSTAAAWAYLRDNSGILFDPAVVQALGDRLAEEAEEK